MKTVQVAIRDPVYADSIRNLLIQDGGHLVHLVPKPDVTLDGVMVVEAANLHGFPLSNEMERLGGAGRRRAPVPEVQLEDPH
jgi:hypothetical protein